MADGSTSIAEFLSATAARQPTPGGGSVAALAGALAAAAGEMVVNYSLGKKGLEAHAPELADALARLARARQLLLDLMVEDQAAYHAMTAIRKLPLADPQRQAKFDAALLACIRAPQAVAAAAMAVLDLCGRLVEIVNVHLLSDLAVCAELAMATLRCGLYNVQVNLSDLPEADRAGFQRSSADVLSRATESIRQVVPRIWARHARKETTK